MEGTVGKGDKPLIELNNIHKIYQMGGESVHANDGISLTICRGEFVAIVGKSGSGKSTLMNIIGALDVPTSGEYFLGGEDVRAFSETPLHPSLRLIFRQKSSNLIDVHSMYAS